MNYLLVGDLKKIIENVPDDYFVDSLRWNYGKSPTYRYVNSVEVNDHMAKIVLRAEDPREKEATEPEKHFAVSRSSSSQVVLRAANAATP